MTSPSLESRCCIERSGKTGIIGRPFGGVGLGVSGGGGNGGSMTGESNAGEDEDFAIFLAGLPEDSGSADTNGGL